MREPPFKDPKKKWTQLVCPYTKWIKFELTDEIKQMASHIREFKMAHAQPHMREEDLTIEGLQAEAAVFLHTGYKKQTTEPDSWKHDFKIFRSNIEVKSFPIKPQYIVSGELPRSQIEFLFDNYVVKIDKSHCPKALTTEVCLDPTCSACFPDYKIIVQVARCFEDGIGWIIGMVTLPVWLNKRQIILPYNKEGRRNKIGRMKIEYPQFYVPIKELVPFANLMATIEFLNEWKLEQIKKKWRLE